MQFYPKVASAKVENCLEALKGLDNRTVSGKFHSSLKGFAEMFQLSNLFKALI